MGTGILLLGLGTGVGTGYFCWDWGLGWALDTSAGTGDWGGHWILLLGLGTGVGTGYFCWDWGWALDTSGDWGLGWALDTSAGTFGRSFVHMVHVCAYHCTFSHTQHNGAASIVLFKVHFAVRQVKRVLHLYILTFPLYG